MVSCFLLNKTLCMGFLKVLYQCVVKFSIEITNKEVNVKYAINKITYIIFLIIFLPDYGQFRILCSKRRNYTLLCGSVSFCLVIIFSLKKFYTLLDLIYINSMSKYTSKNYNKPLTFSIIPSSPLLITSRTILPALPATDTDEANNLTMSGALFDILYKITVPTHVQTKSN